MDAQPLRILVVDDRCDAADSLAILLRVAGHEVHVAYDGAACLAKACKLRFDAILLDIGMPRLDGYEVAKQIRQESACKNSVLIAVTGYADHDHRQQGQDAGFDDYLVKPIDPAALLSKLSRLSLPSFRRVLDPTIVAA
jgi:CheY-like chemotaxis protein